MPKRKSEFIQQELRDYIIHKVNHILTRWTEISDVVFQKVLNSCNRVENDELIFMFQMIYDISIKIISYHGNQHNGSYIYKLDSNYKDYLDYLDLDPKIRKILTNPEFCKRMLIIDVMEFIHETMDASNFYRTKRC